MNEPEELIAELFLRPGGWTAAQRRCLKLERLMVEQRPDWDDIARGSGWAWLTATAIANDLHAFAARVQAIISLMDG